MTTTRRTFLEAIAASAWLHALLHRTAVANETLADDRSHAGAASCYPENLRVEWLTAPLGIDTRRPRFSWTLKAIDAGARNLRQQAYRVIVATLQSAIRAGRGDLWDSGRIESTQFTVIPQRDLGFASQSDVYWALKIWDGGGRATEWSAPRRFATGLLHAQDWQAQWIAAEADPRPLRITPPPAINTDPPVEPRPLPLFRHSFELAKPLRSALVSVCGLGHYELRINGAVAAQTQLDPGWTNYRKTVLYNTLDVTGLLRPGKNALGVLLGNGMFNVEKYAGRYTKFVGTFGRPKLILQLKLLFEDGSEQLIVSDASWRTRAGPIVFSSVFGGEDFDARREPKDWDRAGADETDWGPALQVDGPGGELRAQGMPSVTVARTIHPQRSTQLAPGVIVFDLGENFSGWPSITVTGRAGSTVKFIPGELLDREGRVSQRSANAAPGREASFSYTLQGTAKESWRPRFTYWGFRYIQAEFPDDVTLLSLHGEFLHTELPRVGEFASSDNLLVRTHGLIVQALLSNTFSVLTDCPHREKLGWLEQTHLNADTVFYNLDAVTLYRKLLVDIQDAQLDSGQVPEIAPEFIAFLNQDGSDSIFRESPEWGSAIVLSMWAAYRYSGDHRLLDDGYRAMGRYARYLEGRRLADGLLDHGLGDWYDIGPKPVGEAQLTSRKLTGTATYFQLLTTLAAIAATLGKPHDADDWSKQAAAVRDAINTQLFDASRTTYDRGSMTAFAMPLALGIVPSDKRESVLAKLVATIRAHDDHVTAGDVGFHYVVRALMENDRGDVLHAMLSRTDPPSYGAQLAQGATALTEAWDANPTKSQNHFMLGHAETWLYGGLAGIRVDMSRNDANRISIAPQLVAGVDAASARYQSVLGSISSTWRRRDGRIELTVTVPTGVQAMVTLPATNEKQIRENGRPMHRAVGILSAKTQGRHYQITLGSGQYTFDFADPARANE